MAYLNTTKYPFPATAPTSAQTINLLTITGKQANEARRLILTIRSSHDSGASGLVISALYDNGTTYRNYTTYTHLAATTANPTWTYDIATPLGASGIKVDYTNSASVLTSWEGAIATTLDERAAP